MLLTLLGGGAFGNENPWIFHAIRRAFTVCRAADLDIRIVSYGRPGTDLIRFADGLGR